MRTSYIVKKELFSIPALSNVPIHIACQKLTSVTNHVLNRDARIGTKIIISTVVSHIEDHMTFNDLMRPVLHLNNPLYRLTCNKMLLTATEFHRWTKCVFIWYKNVPDSRLNLPLKGHSRTGLAGYDFCWLKLGARCLLAPSEHFKISNRVNIDVRQT